MYVPILFCSFALSVFGHVPFFYLAPLICFFFPFFPFLLLLVGLQACRERIKGRQAKIAAFTQRMNLINQRGTPDQQEMTS
jgi:hypothetical protein